MGILRSLIIVFLFSILFSSCEKDESTDYLEFVSIPPGTFAYGNSGSAEIDYEFEIMKFEVTNDLFYDYLRTSMNNDAVYDRGDHLAGWYSGDSAADAGEYPFLYYNSGSRILIEEGELKLDKDYRHHPVVEVTWYGAVAFAEYHGGRLPTQHEWGKAARGNEFTWFPWQDTLAEDRANYQGSGDPWESESIETTPVGYYDGRNNTRNSPSCYGVYDQFGNAAEWTSDPYAFSGGILRVVRGCSWATQLRPFPSILNKYTFYPDQGNTTIGFRIIRD